LSTLAIVPPKTEYDRRNEAEFRDQVLRGLGQTYDRRGDVIVPIGKRLAFTSPQGQVIVFGYDANGNFTIQNDAGLQGIELADDDGSTELTDDTGSVVLVDDSQDPVIFASVNYVQSVEAGLTQAVATVETEVTAQIEDVSASVTAEQTARVNGDTALATSISNLTSTVTTNNTNVTAAITQEATTRANADTALSTSIQTLTSNYQSADTALQASITAEQTARVNADTALSSSIETVSATAAAKNRTFVQTTAPTASAAGDLWIDSDDNNKLYRASAAGSGSWVAVPYSDSAKVTTFAQASAPTAIAIGDLWIDTDDNNKVYRATAVGSGSWSAVDDARITTNASAIATVDGKLTASYALTVDAGGRIASMKLLSDGTTSSVKFTASTFQIFNGSTDEAPFVVEGGIVKAKKVQATSLSAVSADTGALTVSGTLTLGSSGKIITSGTAYNGNGIFLGEDGAGVYKFSVGGASGKLAFDGTDLTLPGGRLVDGSVEAGKLNVSQLSAITATIGTLRTATSGARVEIKDNIIEVYDSTRLRVRMGIWT
jgi:hypothetical protein